MHVRNRSQGLAAGNAETGVPSLAAAVPRVALGVPVVAGVEEDPLFAGRLIVVGAAGDAQSCLGLFGDGIHEARAPPVASGAAWESDLRRDHSHRAKIAGGSIGPGGVDNAVVSC